MDQTTSGTDQTLSDADQTVSDADQTGADADQMSAERDQPASDSDQAASDHDLAAGVNPEAHEFSRSMRERSTREREQTAHERLRAAGQRDAVAQARDLAALARDRAADARDLAMAQVEAVFARQDDARALTGAELDHELDRARRARSPLVVAYVDVVGLKQLNDREGHVAGDALLQRVVTEIQKHLRTYDLIVRMGGDEFLCAMSNMTLADARERFRAIAATISGGPDPGATGTGFAQLLASDSIVELIARADSELIRGVR